MPSVQIEPGRPEFTPESWLERTREWLVPGGTRGFTELKQKLGTFCCVREVSTYEENLARFGGQNICLILSHLRSYESGPAPAVAVLLSKFW